LQSGNADYDKLLKPFLADVTDSLTKVDAPDSTTFNESCKAVSANSASKHHAYSICVSDRMVPHHGIQKQSEVTAYDPAAEAILVRSSACLAEYSAQRYKQSRA
jgi:hypothetical protein